MIKKISILGGLNKDGLPEKVDKLDVEVGEVLAVVGPTGSGKTQLISDIEQYAEEENITGRHILIDGQAVLSNNDKRRSRCLVAQVSQNMNFVIDMVIEEFLMMHAMVRGITDPLQTIKEVLAITNRLSGEPVSLSTNLTQLSGGQSRALMVADVALISDAPVVLIDEIENAGIDRLQALEVLKGQGKIVLVVSHDPTLMLMAGRRVVMKNGGMERTCLTTPKEKQILEGLKSLEKQISNLRDHFRQGKSIGIMDNEEEEKEESLLWQEFWCTVR